MVSEFEIEIGNYRCFSGAGAVKLRIAGNRIAIVGPNNGGKTTVLRLFMELSSLFEALLGRDLPNCTSGQPFQAYPQHVSDVADIVPRPTSGPTQIRIGLLSPEPANDQLSWVSAELVAAENGMWKAAYGTRLQHLESGRRLDRSPILHFRTGSSETQIDPRPLQSLLPLFQDAMFIPAGRVAVGPGEHGVFGKLATGAAFVSRWSSMSAGSASKRRASARQVERTLARIFGWSNLSIRVSPDQSTLIVEPDDGSFDIRDMGTGFQQFFQMLANVAWCAPSILLIDEPEAGLHAAMQSEVLNTLAELTTSGTVIFATHSLGLARTSADDLYVARRSGGVHTFAPIQSHPALPALLGEVNFSSYPDLGYRCLLLVEGIADVRVFRELLKKWHIDHLVVCLPLGGGEFITLADRSHELAEVQRTAGNAKVLAIIDSEREQLEGPPSEDHAAFAQQCAAQRPPIECHILERRSLENYLSSKGAAALGRSAPLGPVDKVGGRFKKTQNWKGFQTMTRADFDGTDLGRFLDQLAQDLAD